MAGGPFVNKGYMGLGGYGVPGSDIEGGVPSLGGVNPPWMSGGPPPVRPAPAMPAANAAAWQAGKARAAMGAGPPRAPGMGMAQPARGAPRGMPMPAMAGRAAGARAAYGARPPATSPLQGTMDKLRSGASAPMTGTFAKNNLKPGMP